MIAIDIESSGLDYRVYSIVSLGAVDLLNPTNQFYGECRVFEGAHISDEALEVNGFTRAELMDPNKPSEAELIIKFMEWTRSIKDRTLLGQNVSFDRDMAKAACDRANYNWDIAHRTIDTHTLCYMHMIKNAVVPPFDEEHHRTALNLDAVLNYCGIPDEPEPHNGLTGAKSHAEVASRLLFGRKLLPDFSEFEIPW